MSNIAVYEKESVVAVAAEIHIVSHTALAEAVETLSKLNQLYDRITAEKEKVTKPLNEALKAERGRWKPLETLYETAIATLRGKMTAYQTAMVAEQKKEEAKLIARVGEGKGKLRVETVVRKLAEAQQAPDKVSTDAGMVKFKTVQKFEVMNFAELPDNYKLANEVAIRESMKTGASIPGVRFFEEQTPINFR